MSSATQDTSDKKSGDPCVCAICGNVHVYGQNCIDYFPPVQDDNGNDELLHVVVPINNYVRYSKRYFLFFKFLKHMQKFPLIRLYIVEIAFGSRPFICTKEGNPRHLQLRTSDELWHKENSINLMVQRFPKNWKYMAWVDGDITFMNEEIDKETIQQLQHYQIVQMFESVVNMGAKGQVMNTHKGFGSQYIKRPSYEHDLKNRYEFWHPGFAWAMTREAWNAIGGLIEFAILGAADHHMALCFIGQGRKSVPGNISKQYLKQIMEFEQRCNTFIKRDIGFVPGTIFHGFHGKMKDRKYIERWSIITKNEFDPATDIKKDWQGLFIFDTDKPKLRDEIRAYMRQRNEDSIDDD